MTKHFDDNDPEFSDPEIALLLKEIEASIISAEAKGDSETPLGAHEALERKQPEPKPAPTDVVGGFAFFLSLGAILPTGVILVALSLQLLSGDSSKYAGSFVAAAAVGALCAHLFIKGHISVLIHEFKHSLVSNLVGNKRKGMKIGRDSGYFEYAYSKETKHFNAFISVAPYIVPVFTFVAALLAFATARQGHLAAVLIVGFGYGIDLVLNIRDISPVQTDLSLIRGGYRIGVLYVVAWNVLIFGVLTSWILGGISGWMHILESLSVFFVKLHQWYSHMPTSEG